MAEPSIISLKVAFTIAQVDRKMGEKCEIICEQIDVKSIIWDVAASNATASGIGSRIGQTWAVIGGADTLTIFRTFELNANAIDTKYKRALEAVLGDVSEVNTDVSSGSTFRSQ